jgi:hypothetical protein
VDFEKHVIAILALLNQYVYVQKFNGGCMYGEDDPHICNIVIKLKML